MNIAAVMAALDDNELDHSAKHCLVVLSCRADRYTGSVTVPIRRIAADMSVHWDTAWRALQRLEEAGRLMADKRRGFSTTWHLTIPRQPRTGSRLARDSQVPGCGEPAALVRHQPPGLLEALQGPPGGVPVDGHVGRDASDRDRDRARVTVSPAAQDHQAVLGRVVELVVVESGHDRGDVHASSANTRRSLTNSQSGNPGSDPRECWV